MTTAPILFITDPWQTLDHPRDTSLRLIEEAIALGARVAWADVRSIRWEDGRTRLDASEVEAVYPGRSARNFKFAEMRSAEPREFSRILYRTDPPVDLAYTQPLQMLLLGLSRKVATEIINRPEILLQANEKLEAGLLGELMPPTCAAAALAPLERFGQSEGRAVLKPLHQAQSKGVELLDFRTLESAQMAREALRTATAEFTRPVLLQKYLQGISEGEQRLWFVNGHLLAAVRKRPAAGEFRIDMDRGGTVAPTELTPRERKAAARIGKLLRSQKIRLAAVDLIEGLVTDFNFTSPGLLVQMEQLLAENLARPVIESIVNDWK